MEVGKISFTSGGSKCHRAAWLSKTLSTDSDFYLNTYTSTTTNNIIIIPMTCPHSYSTTCNNETYTSYIPLTHLILNARAPAMAPMQYPCLFHVPRSAHVVSCLSLLPAQITPLFSHETEGYIGFVFGFCTLWVLLFILPLKRTLPSRFMQLLLWLSFAGHFDHPRMVLNEKDMMCTEFMPQWISFVHIFPWKLLYQRNGWWTRGWWCCCHTILYENCSLLVWLIQSILVHQSFIPRWGHFSWICLCKFHMNLRK